MRKKVSLKIVDVIRGKMGNATLCPVARALKRVVGPCKVYNRTAWITKTNKFIIFPKKIQKFIKRFDFDFGYGVKFLVTPTKLPSFYVRKA
jgi:hypothetical protein